jgi:tRNA1(Val) A37 N6-methylase TrmN6
MVAALEPTASVNMYFQPSETFDFSRHRYDLVMTSPPYFRLEEYEKMPEYGSKQGFLDVFFRPVVAAAWAGLEVGGHMALNMPSEMYDAVRDLLPRVTRTIVLPVHNRHPVGARVGVLNNAPRGEVVYVWRKMRRQTRGRKQPIELI